MSNETRAAASPPYERLPVHRRRFLVDRPFQFRLLSVFATIWIANSLFFTMVLYFFFEGHLRHFYELTPREGMYPVLSLQALFGLSIAFVMIFGLIMLLLVGLYLSNQIAGPLFRMKKCLARVGAGDWDFRLQFRQRDFLRDVPTLFNAMLQGLRQRNEAYVGTIRGIESSEHCSEDTRRRLSQLRESMEATPEAAVGEATEEAEREEALSAHGT